MVEMPPTIDCASALWRTIRTGPPSTVDADAINSRQYAAYSVFNSGPLAALIGTNINPANGVQGYQGENSIAIDPNNAQHLTAHSNTFFQDPTAQCISPTGGSGSTFGTMSLFGSSDGGATWTYNCAPWHTAVTGGIPSANAWFGSDPTLAWNNSGTAYAAYMLLSEDAAGNAGAAIVLARSTNNGLTWSQFGNPVVNRITLTTNFDDKPMFAIDNTSGQAHSFPGRFYVIWDEGNVERIAHSDDGLTWTTVQPSSNTGAIGGNVAIAPDGTVYAVWTRYNVENTVFSKSTDGGATWTAPVIISGTIALQSFGSNNTPPPQNTRGINSFAAIDVDRNPSSAFFGNIYVSFTDFPSGTSTGADLNVYMIRSTNGGTSWSTRLKVNDDNWGATQFFPWLAVDQSDGSVNMSWLDSRIDPINRKTQSVYARSVDGGVTFESNILVDDNGANWRNNVNYSDENTVDNPNFNGNQYGDYSGIAALNRQVHPLWTDSRSFFPTADTQSPTRREDNGTSAIINCSAPSAVSAPAVNSSTTPSVAVTWSAPAGWGTNATNGTYSVYRNTTPVFPGGAALASGLTATSYVDSTGVASTTYYYFVRAKNNCPGTALTPMTSDSAASAAVVYGSAGTAFGTLQGTVTSAGSPVSNVVVFAGTLSATTNGSGFYQMPGINAGTYTVSASPAGYSAVSVNGVVVSGGSTTVQDLALTPNSSSSCFTDTNFGDFTTGTGTNVEIASSPGDVKLTVASGGPNIRDQHADDNGFGSGYGFSNTSFIGQTFTPSVTAAVTKVDTSLFCASCSGTNPNITLELRTTSGSQPVMTAGGLIASSTVAGTSSGSSTTITFTFNNTLTAGVQYGLVIKLAAARTGTQAWAAASSDVYAGGRRVICSSTSCANPTGQNANNDLLFIEYNTTPNVYQTSGNFISSTKDSGAVVGTTPTWTTLSWNNTALPSGTNIQFQAAASNSSSGPFNFVGPDNTASTFFSSGASLSQFNGNRYLKYKALLSTSNTANTPTLNDATVCFADLVPPLLSSASARKTHNGAGTFNLPLSLNGRTVEPRGDGSGTHTIVFTFDRTVTSGTATVTSGAGTAGTPTFSGTSMIIPLTGVTDQQAVTLRASNVSGPGTATLPSVSVNIGFLWGDVTGDAFVNAGDTIVVRNNAGVTLDGTNFQNDVNFDGQVDVGDTTIVRNNSGHFLP